MKTLEVRREKFLNAYRKIVKKYQIDVIARPLLVDLAQKPKQEAKEAPNK